MPRAPATTALVGDGRLAIGCDRDDLEQASEQEPADHGRRTRSVSAAKSAAVTGRAGRNVGGASHPAWPAAVDQ